MLVPFRSQIKKLLVFRNYPFIIVVIVFKSRVRILLVPIKSWNTRYLLFLCIRSTPCDNTNIYIMFAMLLKVCNFALFVECYSNAFIVI